MTDAPTTDDVRDIWVDYHLNPLPRAKSIVLVPQYQAAFDAWLETIRVDERERYTVNNPMLLADLSDKIEELRLKHRTSDWDYHEALDDVQALLDGSFSGVSSGADTSTGTETLRVKVEALDGITFGRSVDAWIRREEVLALLDGSSS